MFKCTPTCKGWDVFIPSGSAYYIDEKPCIQRCDNCDRYADDYTAQKCALKSASSLPRGIYLYSKSGQYVCTVGSYLKDPSRYILLLRK
jgi:hypothetical protein